MKRFSYFSAIALLAAGLWVSQPVVVCAKTTQETDTIINIVSPNGSFGIQKTVTKTTSPSVRVKKTSDKSLTDAISNIETLPQEHAYKYLVEQEYKLKNAQLKMEEEERSSRLRLEKDEQMFKRNTVNSFLNLLEPESLQEVITGILVLLIIFGSIPIACVVIVLICQRHKTRRRKQREEILVEMAKAGQPITPELIYSLGINQSAIEQGRHLFSSVMGEKKDSSKEPKYANGSECKSNAQKSSSKGETASETKKYFVNSDERRATIDYCLRKGAKALVLLFLAVLCWDMEPIGWILSIPAFIFAVQVLVRFLNYYLNRDYYAQEAQAAAPVDQPAPAQQPTTSQTQQEQPIESEAAL